MNSNYTLRILVENQSNAFINFDISVTRAFTVIRQYQMSLLLLVFDSLGLRQFYMLVSQIKCNAAKELLHN